MSKVLHEEWLEQVAHIVGPESKKILAKQYRNDLLRWYPEDKLEEGKAAFRNKWKVYKEAAKIEKDLLNWNK